MGRSLKNFKVSIIAVLKTLSGHGFTRELVVFSPNQERRHFHSRSFGIQRHFDGRNRAARYQLSIAVSAPFAAHDSLYCSRSGSEKTPGGEVFRSTRTSSAQSRLCRRHSGSQGS